MWGNWALNENHSKNWGWNWLGNERIWGKLFVSLCFPTESFDLPNVFWSSTFFQDSYQIMIRMTNIDQRNLHRDTFIETDRNNYGEQFMCEGVTLPLFIQRGNRYINIRKIIIDSKLKVAGQALSNNSRVDMDLRHGICFSVYVISTVTRPLTWGMYNIINDVEILGRTHILLYGQTKIHCTPSILRNINRNC